MVMGKIHSWIDSNIDALYKHFKEASEETGHGHGGGHGGGGHGGGGHGQGGHGGGGHGAEGHGGGGHGHGHEEVKPPVL